MSTVEVAEAAPPPPEEIRADELKEHQSSRLPETYFRWGYVVGGAEPRQVEKYTRMHRFAVEHAKRAAAKVRDQLREIGAPAEVFWWVQRWQVQTTDAYEVAEIQSLTEGSRP